MIKCHLLSKFRFVEPPVLDMASVVEDSSTRTPLIFVLSPGVVSSLVKRDCFSCLCVTDLLVLFDEEMVNIPNVLVLKMLDCFISPW